MVDCDIIVYCGNQANHSLAESTVQVINKFCEPGGKLECGDVVYLVLNSTLACLTDCRARDPDYLPWVRPVTCAGIAVSALIFFALLYFGKTWTEARGTDRRLLRKQDSMNGHEGVNWNRLKISVLAGSNRNQHHCTGTPPDTPRMNQGPRVASELEMAMYDTKT